MPFGERTAEWTALNPTHRRTLRPGSRATTFRVGETIIGTPICYEGLFTGVCERFEGATLLINGANDAWFEDTPGSALHGMLVSARAVEMGVPVIRAANTGVSFVVEPTGRRTYETGLFQEVARRVEVRNTAVRTGYMLGGRWFPLGCALGLVVLPLRPSTRQKPSRPADTRPRPG